MANSKKYIEIKGYYFTPQRYDTKVGHGMVTNYQHANISDINVAYDRPSEAKRRAFRECQKMCEELNGRYPRITGHNSQLFSYAFKMNYEGEWVIVYITRDHNYIILP